MPGIASRPVQARPVTGTYLSQTILSPTIRVRRIHLLLAMAFLVDRKLVKHKPVEKPE